MSLSKSNIKEEEFVYWYLKLRNATKAYLKINPSVKRSTARTQGHKTLNRPRVRKKIDEAILEAREGCKQDLERVLFNLANIANANIADYLTQDEFGRPVFDVSEITYEQFSAIQELSIEENPVSKTTTTKIKLYDKRNVLIELGKHFGGFRTNVDVKGDFSLKDLICKSNENEGQNGN